MKNLEGDQDHRAGEPLVGGVGQELGAVGLAFAVYLLGGCIMDALALVMLTIPIFYPVIVHLGYDPIWFGIIMVVLDGCRMPPPPVRTVSRNVSIFGAVRIRPADWNVGPAP